MEQRIARKDDLVVAVLHEPADTVLGVAWRVQALDGDAPQLEAVTVGRRLRHAIALFSADDGELLVAELRELGTGNGQLHKVERLVSGLTIRLFPPA